ncbi:hypothetical protein C8J56DRAFT_1058676 [Mycena floridula]|nr:hypothetical protein C8J56DRAFT_1058676 [Mycena floridula]
MRKTGFGDSDDLLDRIIAGTIQTGLLTATTAILILVLFLGLNTQWRVMLILQGSLHDLLDELAVRERVNECDRVSGRWSDDGTNLPEELLHQVLFLLVDDSDYEYKRYPESLYHYASGDIFALSLVNSLFRRICFPLLFSYVKCRNLEELQELEHECIANSLFTGFIRILEVVIQIPYSESIRLTVLRLVPRLRSLAWLDLHDIQIDLALLATINAHATLKTAVTRLYILPQPPVSLDKVLVYRIRELQAVESILGMRQTWCRIAHYQILCDTPDCIPNILIPDLREVSVNTIFPETVAGLREQFHVFVANHPSVTKVNINGLHCQWEQGNFSKPHLSAFLNAFRRSSLRRSISQLDIALTPLKPGDGFDKWEITGLSLGFSDTNLVLDPLVDTLTLASEMFPKVSSLTVKLKGSLQIHTDVFVALISYFPKIRVFYFEGIQCLTGTPLPLRFEKESQNPFGALSACMQSSAWCIFIAIPSLTRILTKEKGPKGSGLAFSSSYAPQRDLSGALVRMKVKHEGSIPGISTQAFGGSVVP